MILTISSLKVFSIVAIIHLLTISFPLSNNHPKMYYRTMGVARHLLFLFLCFTNITNGFQMQPPEPDSWRSEVPDGGDGSTQIPFCELQMMTTKDKTMLKAHIKELLMKNHHRHYHKMIRLKRATVAANAKIWNKLPAQKGDQFFYIIPFSVRDKYAIEDFQPVLDSMAAIQKSTCIFFDHIDSNEKKQKYNGEDYLAIVNQPGCHSVIGRHSGGKNKGENILQLELSKKKIDPATKKWSRRTCMKRRIIIHELLHLLGLFHEHQRSDRNKYLEVDFSNIRKDKKNNFEKQKDDQSWGFPFNFESIMNYRQNAFAIDPSKLTIRIRNGNELCQLGMGMHEHASELDFLLVNMLYNCPGVERKVNEFIERHFFIANPKQKHQHNHGNENYAIAKQFNAKQLKKMEKTVERILKKRMWEEAQMRQKIMAQMHHHNRQHNKNKHHHHSKWAQQQYMAQGKRRGTKTKKKEGIVQFTGWKGKGKMGTTKSVNQIAVTH